MSDHRASAHPSRSREALRGSLSVALVLALAGTLFVANARLNRDTGERHPQDLRGLAAAEDERVSELAATLEQLRDEVDALSGQHETPTQPSGEDVAARAALAAGYTTVEGPGITVTLDDADPSPSSLDDDRYTADDYVVHQQDLQAVINALWAGGAEAMTIQGHRVTATTAVRCVGNVLLLQGRVYSPPYRISAIGDPAALRASLDRDSSIALYRQWVAVLGLGWDVRDEDALTMDPYQGPGGLDWATLPEGVSPFAGAATEAPGADTGTTASTTTTRAR